MNLIFLIIVIVCSLFSNVCDGYFYYKPCTNYIQNIDFQLPNCYIPDMNPTILLSAASFVMSHDAATGYLNSNNNNINPEILLKLAYTKNQKGTMYNQLQYGGARAFDLRPYLLNNGTIVFHHGIIIIPVTLEQILYDVLLWTKENPTELVLLLTSHFGYESKTSSSSTSSTSYSTTTSTTTDMVSSLAQVYKKYGITYVPCTAIYDMTVGDVMETLAKVSTPSSSSSYDDDSNYGYVLALDGHDISGTFCGKENWDSNYVEQLSCYPNRSVSCYSNNQKTSSMSTSSSTVFFDQYMKQYLLDSNSNTDSTISPFGPSADTYNYPFNVIQGLWQITTKSTIIGLSHFSTIVKDTEQSKLHKNIIVMVYNNLFYKRSISLLAIDDVSHHGNAILSVLRTTCGQSKLNNNECGTQLPIPQIATSFYIITPKRIIITVLVLYVLFVLFTIHKTKRPRLLFTVVVYIQDTIFMCYQYFYSFRHQHHHSNNNIGKTIHSTTATADKEVSTNSKWNIQQETFNNVDSSISIPYSVMT